MNTADMINKSRPTVIFASEIHPLGSFSEKHTNTLVGAISKVIKLQDLCVNSAHFVVLNERPVKNYLKTYPIGKHFIYPFFVVQS